MTKFRHNVLPWLLLLSGLVLIGLFIADKADTAIGICGMILCTLAVAVKRGNKSNQP